MGITKLTGLDLNTVCDENDTHVLEPCKQQVFAVGKRAVEAYTLLKGNEIVEG